MRRRISLFLPLLLLASLLGAGQPLAAGDSVVIGFSGALGENGLPASWSLKRWAPVLTAGSDFEAIGRVDDSSGRRALFIKAVKAGLTVGTRRAVDVNHYRYASWSWKAQELPTNASFRSRSTNDQALQLLFGFEGGKAVGYIWDSTGSPGASGSGLSWQEDVRVIVLQAGPGKLGQWVSERVDLLADYRKLFGQEPSTLGGIGLQCNSQHTASTASGYLGTITLSAE